MCHISLNQNKISYCSKSTTGLYLKTPCTAFFKKNWCSTESVIVYHGGLFQLKTPEKNTQTLCGGKKVLFKENCVN